MISRRLGAGCHSLALAHSMLFKAISFPVFLASVLAANAGAAGLAADGGASAAAAPDADDAIVNSIRSEAGDSAAGVIEPPQVASDTGVFRPATGLRDSLRHHRNLIQDDIWWTVTGDEMAWTHKNAHQLFPTANVYRNGAVRALESAPVAAIGGYPVTTPTGALPFDEFLDSRQSTAMGVVILHEGKIVFERYPRMRDYEKPIYWSVAKVMPATVIRILEERGEVEVSRPIEAYLPELAASDFAGTSVRNILDMASGLDCQDEYDDRQSCYYRYSMAIGDGYRDAKAPDNPYDFLATLRVSRHAPQGAEFSYSGVNTFLLGWLVEKLTGYPFQDVFTREIWWHLGAEADASFIAYRYGIPLTHGGFLAKPRDLARFGLLFTPSYGVVSPRRIISKSHIELLRFGSNPALREYADAGAAGEVPYIHNIYQWDYVHPDGTLYKGGWGGQGLIVNPVLDIVAVFASYFKDDEYSEVDLDKAIFEVLNGVYGMAAPLSSP